MKKLKIIAIISGILTAVQLLFPVFPTLMLALTLAGFKTAEAGAIGIIGGADGPTAIYTTTTAGSTVIIARYLFLAACVLTFIVSIILLIRNRNKRQ